MVEMDVEDYLAPVVNGVRTDVPDGEGGGPPHDPREAAERS